MSEPARRTGSQDGQEGCTRGGAVWVGTWEGYTGTLPGTLPVPIFNHILASKPYPRPNEGLFSKSDEVS